MKKFLVMKEKGTQLCLSVTEESEIIKNPIPILWFNEGLYGWIPVEVVKNEIEHVKDIVSLSCVGTPLMSHVIRFVWSQTKSIIPEVGKLLISLAEE